MILESIHIENIRSIKKLDLNLPSSSILFYGDVGSGKSSILKAIEFALFGTLTHANLRGDSILRRGDNIAKVELTFSIDRKRYTIIRGLSKNREGKVSQTSGKFIDHEAGTEIKYAPTDLRILILKLLSYSITRYEKAQKLPLFRYTVYTPQEQVKEIILADPEDRFEILKEVFGIEKYETALKNADIIKDYLNNQIREITGRLKQIGDPEELIPDKQDEIKELKLTLKKLENQLKKEEELIVREEQKTEEIQGKYNDYIEKLTELKNQEQILNKSEKTKKENNESLVKLKREINQADNKLKNLKEVNLETYLTEKQIKVQINEERSKKSEKIKSKAILDKSIKDIDKLLNEGKCALCGQAIHEKERFENELSEANEKLEILTQEINNIESSIKELEKSLENLQEFKLFDSKRKSLNELINEKRKRESDLKALLNELEEKIDKASSEIRSTLKKYEIENKTDFKQLGAKIKEDLNQQKIKVSHFRTKKENLSNNIAEEKTNLKQLQRELSELKKAIKLKESLKRKQKYLSELGNCIVVEFPTLIRDIERKILSSSAQHFNTYFKEWFHILVEEQNIDVEIRPDDFQPMINVNGYESPFRDLSGGEKSALSLSYRLALNKIINERHQEVKTKKILILDEPTDGFSQQQINKMQDIFEKLNTEQMIIISHERNLDSFVTDIFNFEKKNHETIVERENY
ncbi:MAG: AAA family ATPase [Candidatus Hodarchaeota archaeon]